jgi:hypothetical protein
LKHRTCKPACLVADAAYEDAQRNPQLKTQTTSEIEMIKEKDT